MSQPAAAGSQIIFDQALTPKMAGPVLLIATIGQLFCTTACLTSASRMLFAFSRDGPSLERSTGRR